MRYPNDGGPLETSDDIPLIADGSDQPAPDTDSLRQLLPAARRDGEGRMFTAVLKASQAALNFLWSRYGRKINAQKSALFAEGDDLVAWGKYYKRPQQAGETEPEWRNRLLTPVDKKTPDAIATPVKALVNKITNIEPLFLEPAVDAAFAAPTTFSAGAPTWSMFAQPSNRRLWAQDDSRPGEKYGAYVVPNTTYPLFWIVAPDVGDDLSAPHAMDVVGANAEDPVDFIGSAAPTWFAHPPNTKSVYAAAVRLQDGRVLICGGQDSEILAPTTAATIYDPANEWVAAAPMNTARSRHGAILLDNGKVLVVGGTSAAAGNTALGSMELYDPALNTWTTLGGSLVTARHSFSLLRLNDGRLIIVGGHDGTVNLTTSEDATQAALSWTARSMSTARSLGPAVRMRTGRILAVGRGLVGASNVTDIFNPTTNTWTAGATMATARYQPAAALLHDGRVMVCGGNNGSGTHFSSCEFYDEATNTFSPAPAMETTRSAFPLLRMSTGRLMALGGYGAALGGHGEYDPLKGTWQSLGSATINGRGIGMLLHGDRLLLLGGDDGAGTFSNMANDWSPDFRTYNYIPPASNGLFDRIISEVLPRRASGYVWMLLAEPLLGSDA